LSDADCCVNDAAGLFARACKALGQPAVCASIADDAANLRGVLIERLAEMSVRHGCHPFDFLIYAAARKTI